MESVFLVVLESTGGTQMLGKSCSLLADALEALAAGCVAAGIYQIQRKVRAGRGGHA